MGPGYTDSRALVINTGILDARLTQSCVLFNTPSVNVAQLRLLVIVFHRFFVTRTRTPNIECTTSCTDASNPVRLPTDFRREHLLQRLNHY